MARTKKLPVWLVTNPLTHSGGSMEGATAEDAARNALRTNWGRRIAEGAPALTVKAFAGAHRSEDVSVLLPLEG